MGCQKNMKNKIFIDTGGWLACMNKKDKNHKEALEYLTMIRKNNNQMVISNYIMSETLTWLNYNNYHSIALDMMRLWKEAERNNTLKIHWVDKSISDDAWEIFTQFNDQRLSFTDCTSFVICRRNKIKKVFGFDSDFNALGFLLSPYQIHEKNGCYDILRP